MGQETEKQPDEPVVVENNSQASCNSHKVEKSKFGAIFNKNQLVLNIKASFNTKYNQLPNK